MDTDEIFDDNIQQPQEDPYDLTQRISIAGGHFSGISTLFKHMLMKKVSIQTLLEQEQNIIYENVCRAVIKYLHNFGCNHAKSEDLQDVMQQRVDDYDTISQLMNKPIDYFKQHLDFFQQFVDDPITFKHFLAQQHKLRISDSTIDFLRRLVVNSHLAPTFEDFFASTNITTERQTLELRVHNIPILITDHSCHSSYGTAQLANEEQLNVLIFCVNASHSNVPSIFSDVDALTETVNCFDMMQGYVHSKLHVLVLFTHVDQMSTVKSPAQLHGMMKQLKSRFEAKITKNRQQFSFHFVNLLDWASTQPFLQFVIRNVIARSWRDGVWVNVKGYIFSQVPKTYTDIKWKCQW